MSSLDNLGSVSTPRSTPRQREYIEGLREKARLSYSEVLGIAGDLCDPPRDIRDLGELSVGEASEVIDWLMENG